MLSLFEEQSFVKINVQKASLVMKMFPLIAVALMPDFFNIINVHWKLWYFHNVMKILKSENKNSNKIMTDKWRDRH